MLWSRYLAELSQQTQALNWKINQKQSGVGDVTWKRWEEIWFIFGPVKYLYIHDQLNYKYDQSVSARVTKHYWSKRRSSTAAAWLQQTTTNMFEHFIKDQKSQTTLKHVKHGTQDIDSKIDEFWSS